MDWHANNLGKICMLKLYIWPKTKLIFLAICYFSFSFNSDTKIIIGIKQIFLYLSYHHHHHIVLVARISLTLSRHSSLSFIALGRSSGQHPVFSHSCWMYVRAGRPAFARPCVGVHKSTCLMSLSLLLQQCLACLVRLTWIVFVMGAGGRTVGVLWGVAARTCLRLHVAFLCNCRLASSPAVLLASI